MLKTKKRKSVKVASPPTFKQVLVQIRKDIFECAFDPDICGFATINQLADKAELSWATVERLYRGITTEPRLHTIFKLCRAIKMDIHLVKEELSKARK